MVCILDENSGGIENARSYGFSERDPIRPGYSGKRKEIMAKTALVGMAILFVFSWASTLRGQEKAGDGFAWKTDLGKARAEAKESGRPLLVVFR